MSRLLLSSAGTLGDFLPMIALGRELGARGHAVRLAVDPSMAHWVRHAGLDYLPCGPARGEALVRAEPHLVDHWRDAQRALTGGATDGAWEAQHSAFDLPGQARDLRAACEGADLLVATSLQAAAPLVHEATGIPWISVTLMPMTLPHAGDPPREALAPEQLALKQRNRRWYQGVRATLGMRPLAEEQLTASQRAPRGLLASSLHFSQPLPEALAGIDVTGFWHFDPSSWAGHAWTPEPAIDASAFPDPRDLARHLTAIAADAQRLARFHAWRDRPPSPSVEALLARPRSTPAGSAATTSGATCRPPPSTTCAAAPTPSSSLSTSRRTGAGCSGASAPRRIRRSP